MRQTIFHVIEASSDTKHRHNGRVVKASDLKSDGLCPRRFKSCLCRFTQQAELIIWSVIGSVVEYNVANVVARVRFPDDAFFITPPTCKITYEIIQFYISSCTARWRSGSALGS